MEILMILLQAATGGRQSSPYSSIIFFIVIAIVIVLIVKYAKTNKTVDDISIGEEQTNKVVNVTLIGGIIGLFAVSPQNSLNSTIQKENAKGWKVIQIIPAASGNIFLFIFRFLILVLTIFLYTPVDGYYIVMGRK